MNKVVNNENNSNPRLPIASIARLVISLTTILKEMLFGKK